jgi:uncharacterized HAD superfamily protein
MKEDKLKIGIDIDFTITASPESEAFFALITNVLKDKAEIHIITNRPPTEKGRSETIQELSQLNIHYDYLEITADKAEYILSKGISVYFDDTDEYFLSLPQNVTVFKIREVGNFDFTKHKWVYGDKTGFNFDQRNKGK